MSKWGLWGGAGQGRQAASRGGSLEEVRAERPPGVSQGRSGKRQGEHSDSDLRSVSRLQGDPAAGLPRSEPFLEGGGCGRSLPAVTPWPPSKATRGALSSDKNKTWRGPAGMEYFLPVFKFLRKI